MTDFTDVFVQGAVASSHVSYNALALTEDTTLAWPNNLGVESEVVSNIIEVTPSGAGLSVLMPPATEAGVGSNTLIRNLGADSFTLKKNDGSTIVVVAAGDVKYVYLTDNDTAAGSWSIVAFGVGTSSVDASILAGYGLLAIASTINQAWPVTETAAGTTAMTADRGKLFVFTSGSATLALDAIATLGSNWFCGVRNSGTGTVTVDPSGAELVDGASTLSLSPNESCILVVGTTGVFTVGRGRSNTFLFTKLSKSVAGSSNVTLTAAEAANQIMEFTGLLTGNISVITPAVAGVLYTFNNTTGSFSLTLKTPAGSGLLLTQGSRQVVVNDAVDCFAAQSSTVITATSFPDGSAAAPSLNFTLDTNTGIFRNGTDTLGIAANGTAQVLFGASTLQINTATLDFRGTHALFPDGAVATPSVKVGDEENGLSSPNVGQLSLSGGGLELLRLLSSTKAVTIFGALDQVKGADIASASTTNLTTATGNGVHITGTTTITAVTLGSGMWRVVVFDGALTLTHHATNNNLPGATNITTAAGDRALYWADGTTVYCLAYQRANGKAVVANAISEISGLGANVATALAIAVGSAGAVGVTNANQIWSLAQRGSLSSVSYSASLTLDFATSNNFSVGTLTGNITLNNPTNVVAGQSGIIVLTQDGTGSRTLTLGSNFKKENGTAVTLTTTASAVDYLSYWVETTTRIFVNKIGDVK